MAVVRPEGTPSSLTPTLRWRPAALDALLFVMLVVAAVAFPYTYVSAERDVYSWDLANYWNQTNEPVMEMHAMPRRAVERFAAAMGWDRG